MLNAVYEDIFEKSKALNHILKNTIEQDQDYPGQIWKKKVPLIVTNAIALLLVLSGIEFLVFKIINII